MKYKLSHCLCIETPQFQEAAKFYQELLGIETKTISENSIELHSGDNYLYIDEADTPCIVFEFIVEDLEAARADLEARGCTVVRWKGKGKPCYMRDPFGNLFNLHQP